MRITLNTRKGLVKAMDRCPVNKWDDIVYDINMDGHWDWRFSDWWSDDDDPNGRRHAQQIRNKCFLWVLCWDKLDINIPKGMSMKIARRRINRLQRAWTKQFKHARATRGALTPSLFYFFAFAIETRLVMKDE